MQRDATHLNPAEREFLLHLARRSIVEFAASGRTPELDASQIPPAVRSPRGCFVTLTTRGELRGCIGNILPREPLYRAVMNNACGAAFRDTRFEPVSPAEIPGLEIEISVLTEPQPVEAASPEELLRTLRPGVDGVVLRTGGRTATFLPQVWEKIPGAENFMDALAGKAMLPASAWREPGAVILVYQVEAFEEPKAGHGLSA
jgi:AmmeMemoRadiSam system protein A